MDSALLDAGSRAFARHGFHNVTLEQIATEAGLSRVTLHRRGVGKLDILGALVARATDDYRARMWPVLTSTDAASGRLELALRTLCDAAEASLELISGLSGLTDGIFHADGETVGANTRTVFTEPLVRLIHEGQADGSVRPADPEELATVLFNVVGWSYVHLRSGHGWTPERAKKSVIELATHGVLGDRARPTPGQVRD